MADVAGLADALAGADAALTGSTGTSFEGKVVAHVLAAGRSAGVRVGVVAGDVDDGIDDGIPVLSLVQLGGSTEAAFANAADLAAGAAGMLVARTL